MSHKSDTDTDELLDRSRRGDQAARQQLLARHRGRLCKMVALRLDRRLAGRIDASDVVQEALAEAAQRLSDYLREPPLLFYPWLRRLALDQLAVFRRRHVGAQKRSVRREEQWDVALPDESAIALVDRLIDHESSPSRKLLRVELRERVRQAVARLPGRDREVLVLRHLEQLSVAETAAALGLTEGAVKLRHLRALERLRALWATELTGDEPS